MSSSFPELQPSARVLLGPGPSNIHPRVMKAMLSPVVGHLDPDFVGVMEDIKKLLRMVFRTAKEITFPVSGTGSAGMGAVLANLVEEGDEVVVGVAGAFGAHGQRRAQLLLGVAAADANGNDLGIVAGVADAQRLFEGDFVERIDTHLDAVGIDPAAVFLDLDSHGEIDDAFDSNQYFHANFLILLIKLKNLFAGEGLADRHARTQICGGNAHYI